MKKKLIVAVFVALTAVTGVTGAAIVQADSAVAAPCCKS